MRVILVDASLDLADQIRTDVSGLGVDTASDTREQGDGGSANTKTGHDLEDNGLRAVTWINFVCTVSV